MHIYRLVLGNIYTLDADLPNMDPCENGWQRNQVVNTLVPVLVAPTVAWYR